MEGLPIPQIPEVFFFGALNGTKPLWKCPGNLLCIDIQSPSLQLFEKVKKEISLCAHWEQGSQLLGCSGSLWDPVPSFFPRGWSVNILEKQVGRGDSVLLCKTHSKHIAQPQRETPEWSVLKCSPNSSRSSCDAGGKGNQAGAHVLGRHTLSQKSTRTKCFTVFLVLTLGIMLTLVYLVQKGFSGSPSCLIQSHPIKKA